MSGLGGGTPVREALEGAITAIAAAGCETPRLDAELLLGHVLGVSRGQLIADRTLSVQGSAVREFQNAVRRRAVEREPVAYIIGSKGFRGLELTVDSRALIPRPETELLVEVGLELPVGTKVLDLCTGSGAVALALKQERPDLDVTGSDISAEALALAAENSARLGLEVSWREADLLAGLAQDFAAVLSNPPYVSDSALRSLAPEIARHEPRGALAGGPQGLSVIDALLEQLAPRSATRLVALEIGAGQAEQVGESMRAAGFPLVRFDLDLAGIRRVATGRRDDDFDA